MAAHKEVRLFKSNFLERMTHVHPLVPVLIWLPLITYLFILESSKSHTVQIWALYGALGLGVWSFVEYLFHRFIFHFSAESKLGQWVVFAFHGLHHDDPQSPTRLLMPPIPALIYLSILYGIFSLLMSDLYLNLFFAFFLLGYLSYDYIHFYAHHGKGESGVGKFLKTYHLNHHFQDQNRKYGVSSPIWDIVFRTR